MRKIRCQACKLDVSAEKWKKHIETKTHRFNVSEMAMFYYEGKRRCHLCKRNHSPFGMYKLTARAMGMHWKRFHKPKKNFYKD